MEIHFNRKNIIRFKIDIMNKAMRAFKWTSCKSVKMCATMPETRHAVAWAQHGQMDTAQEGLTNAMEKANSKTVDGELPFCGVVLCAFGVGL